jgi:hypothetical protein
MHAPAQQPTAETDHDTTYYESFMSKKLPGRYYFGQKFTALEIERITKQLPAFAYVPNTTLNMGIGATYGSLH